MKWIDELIGCLSKGAAVILIVLCIITSISCMFAAWIMAMLGLGILNAAFNVGWILSGLMAVYFVVRLNDGFYD